MMLSTLAQSLERSRIIGDGTVAVSHVTHVSRDVRQGTLFVALPGRRTDGQKYIPKALENGAVAVAVPTGSAPTLQVPILELDTPRKDLAHLAASLHGRPSEHLKMIGLTGTNGKTTSAAAVANICRLAGVKEGRIGTNGHVINGRPVQAKMTTPEAPQLHSLLAQMLKEGVECVAMEVSSVGLEEHRVEGIGFWAAGFLNLSQDHLDYHGDMASYGAAKSRLFMTGLRLGGTAIVNIDDAYGVQLADMIRAQRSDVRLWTLSLSSDADIVFDALALSAEGVDGVLKTPMGMVTVRCPLMGGFNAANIAMSVGLCHSVGVSTADIERGLPSLSIRGRMERVNVDTTYTVVVDYAHSPDALERVLKALRPLARGHLWCVFGCGGDRDQTKRAPMGAVSTLADGVVITNDNPRTEDPQEIANAVALGALDAGLKLHTSPALGGVCIKLDRRSAIDSVMGQAQDGDLILVAGKGHETYQEIHGEFLDFDDVDVIRHIASSGSFR